jgi:hypothetical protein
MILAKVANVQTFFGTAGGNGTKGGGLTDVQFVKN